MNMANTGCTGRYRFRTQSMSLLSLVCVRVWRFRLEE